NSPFIDQLFTMGGTQYGIPLRGYDEFSITPHGFDPSASGGQASARAFGKTYLAMTGGVGARLSQMFYVAAFYDAGNVWARAGWGAGAPVAALAQDRLHQLAADPAADTRLRGGRVDLQQGGPGLP